MKNSLKTFGLVLSLLIAGAVTVSAQYGAGRG